MNWPGDPGKIEQKVANKKWQTIKFSEEFGGWLWGWFLDVYFSLELGVDKWCGRATCGCLLGVVFFSKSCFLYHFFFRFTGKTI